MIETAFTPVNAVIGGVLIGLAATLLYATCGRIAGYLVDINVPACAE